ncbi:phosphoribulokinase/uridine kinase [Annulohypoxylon truncatum]|uniref:phosphoribulokinase/uridine kinase n=1 Tax=Annulohypoxylon truncatum TaxID=327061 RepID=UPI0020080B82|nr:phosphoribulokinase/uridine kinase [Annulohypoxylon truncatum]KAI1205149.1 phosphoribulokinase/uridine kinase [Annulohypoxylon truncatum]
MDDQVSRLVDKAWGKFQQLGEGQRLLIAVAGIPGSGKTTLSQIVTKALNARHSALHPHAPAPAAFVPMDGFHLTRAQLSAMPDPERAHARRGAEFTFDGAAFLALVQAVRTASSAQQRPASSSETPSTVVLEKTVYAPSFDHAVKDPVENDIAILPCHRIVVFEGNYVCLDKEPWRSAAALMDERWFVDVDFGTARGRLVRRHVKAGIARDEEEARRRADENDLVNGEQIVRERVGVDEVVVSREDRGWVHE